MDIIRSWFFNKYLEWQKEIGEPRDQIEFAKYLGIAQPTLSNYVSGKRKPGKLACQQIYQATHDLTIYDVCGFARPTEEWAPVPLSRLPARIRKRLDTAMTEINATYVSRSISPESPEAESIAIEVMRKHGFKYSDTE